MAFFGGYFKGFQFVGGNQPGAYYGAEVFALCRAKVQQHFLHLQAAGAQVVHNHQAANIIISLFGGYITSEAVNYNGAFQFKIELFKMVGHALYRAGTGDGIVVGKVKYWVLIKLGYHGRITVASCRSYMLPERVSVAAACGERYRG